MFSRGNESLKNWFQEGTEYILSSQVSVKGRQVKEAFGAGAFDGEDISQSVACTKSIRPTPRAAMERLELKLVRTESRSQNVLTIQYPEEQTEVDACEVIFRAFGISFVWAWS